MSKLLDQFNKVQVKTMPDIRPGDSVLVHQKISAEGGPASGGKESGKDRIQIFEGIVIARKHGKGVNSTITVRKVVDGVGVERVFPVNSPLIAKIEVAKHAKVRRAKLYYLRTAKGKKARLKKKEFALAIAEPDQNPSDIETGKEPAVSETLETSETPVETAKTEEAPK